MQRIVSQVYAEAIGRAFNRIPEPIVDRISYVEFLTGTDPIWAGLHDYTDESLAGHPTWDKRSYRVTAHTCYPIHQPATPKDRRRTTIVIPSEVQREYSLYWVVIHELGHVLDEALGFRYQPIPVTKYAERDRMEAFACAFEAWFSKGYSDYDALMANDPATVALFERLALGEAA